MIEFPVSEEVSGRNVVEESSAAGERGDLTLARLLSF
jgi:hypothetical protein